MSDNSRSIPSRRNCSHCLLVTDVVCYTPTFHLKLYSLNNQNTKRSNIFRCNLPGSGFDSPRHAFDAQEVLRWHLQTHLLIRAMCSYSHYNEFEYVLTTLQSSKESSNVAKHGNPRHLHRRRCTQTSVLALCRRKNGRK